jgi:acetolactate synthase-1/2/3 large subunit
VQKEPVDLALLEQVHLPRPPRHDAHPPLDAHALDELARMLGAARAPVIIAGHGCIRAGARDLVARLSQRLGIPVATSLKAKGVVSEDGPLALGCLGVTSDGAAYRYIVEHSDLVLFLGASFNERTSYLWDAKLLTGKRLAQVDRDAAQLGRVFRPDLAILGDIREALSGLLARLETDMPSPPPSPHPPAPTQPAHTLGDERFRVMAAFFAGLAARFPARAMVFDDNIVFAQSYYQVSDANHYFPNTGISSLGYALPAAIGARLHARLGGRDAPTFAIMGDGGFQMCGMEIMTAVNYAIPLNVVVINNGSMSLIRKNQFQLYGGRYIDCDFVNPDFALLAQSFGIRHHRVETEADVDTLFARADLEGAINLIEILLDKHAFPTYMSDR